MVNERESVTAKICAFVRAWHSNRSREKIFERGFRTTDATGQPGFGLGLALVKSIVAFYHGSIGCNSEPGKGTTFTIRLPT